MLIAAPVWAQTGTISVETAPLDGSFTISTSATLNAAREWEVNYSADIEPFINSKIDDCKDRSRSDCFVDPPYFMTYGAWSKNGVSTCRSANRGAVRGITGHLGTAAWSQTLRTDPDTAYCIAIYAGNQDSFLYNLPITSVWFQTPPDPDPPTVEAPWISQNPEGSCGKETTMALVGQCLTCRYKPPAWRWNFGNNTCVNPAS